MTGEATSPAPRRRVPRAEREREMLDVARRVFADRGFHAATMDEIAAAAGVSKQLVYTYLGSKEELFLAVYRQAVAELGARIDVAAAERSEPDAQLWGGLLAFFAFVDEQREAWSILVGSAASPVPAPAGPGPYPDAPPSAGEVGRLRGAIVRVVAQLFAEARIQAAGGAEDVVGPGETEPAARALVASAEAVAAWWLEHPEVPREEAAGRLMDIVWVGLGGLVTGQAWRPEAERRDGT